MKYDLSNPLHRAQFKARADKLLKDGKAVAELRVCRPARTARQNSYLHAALGYFASQAGYSLDYVKQEYYKRLCNRDIFERGGEKNGEFLHENDVSFRLSDPAAGISGWRCGN